MDASIGRKGPAITAKNQRRKRQMARLRALGVPDAEIARRFDLSRARVGRILGPKNGRA